MYSLQLVKTVGTLPQFTVTRFQSFLREKNSACVGEVRPFPGVSWSSAVYAVRYGTVCRLSRCSVLASPLSERYGLAIRALAVTRVDVSHRQTCRAEML